MPSIGETLVQHLVARDVDVIFGIPGVHTVEHYRGIAASGIRHVTPRHEQGAAFMADGYARASGRPGVALVITGPGITNTITAMGQARADSIPMLVLSAANPASSLGANRGFLHELPNQQALMAHIALKSFSIGTETDLEAAMDEAFRIFAQERPGPVHIELPWDVAKRGANGPVPSPPKHQKSAPAEKEITRAVEIISRAASPVIIAGGGMRSGDKELRQLAEKLDAPVVATSNARGLMHGHDLLVPASPSLRAVRDLLESSDLVIALGTELGKTDFDMYETGSIASFQSMIRVDISDDLLAAHPCELAIRADTDLALSALTQALSSHSNRTPAGAQRAEQTRNAAWEEIGPDMRAMSEIVSAMRDTVPGSFIIGDSTQPVYATNLYYDHDHVDGWFNASSGFGALGYGIPAAIGAAIAKPDTPVICLTGDGGAQFSLPELMTAVDQKLPILFVVWNNRGYREIEESMQRAQVKVVGCSPTPPDFQWIAKACGMPCLRCAPDRDQVSQAITQARKSSGPALLEITVD